MIRSILNSFSTAELVVLVVGGMVVLVLAGVLLTRRLFPRLRESNFEPVADSLRVVYELMFVLIFAFVIASVIGEMGEAEATVASEATSIAQLVRTSPTFDHDDASRVQVAAGDYVHAVASDEWRTMKDGNPSPRAAAALDGLYAAVYQVRPRTNAQSDTYAQALTELDDINSKRRERLNIAAGDLPTFLRVLVIVGLILLIVIEYRPQLRRAAELVFMGVLALITASSFLLTVLLDYPFAGEIAVANTPMKQGALAQFWSEELAFVPQRDTPRKPLTAKSLEGVWQSDAYGTVVLHCYDPATRKTSPTCRPGQVAMRGVYRSDKGTVTGRISPAGEFRGWWTELPSRGAEPAQEDAGRVVWRRFEQPGGSDIIAGKWTTGREGAFKPGWDLQRIGGTEPADLADRFARPGTFFTRPPRRRR